MSIYQVKNKKSACTQPNLPIQVVQNVAKIQEKVSERVSKMPKILDKFKSWIKKTYSAYNQERKHDLILRKKFNIEFRTLYSYQDFAFHNH